MRFTLRNIGVLFIGLAVLFAFATVRLREASEKAELRWFGRDVHGLYSKLGKEGGWRKIKMSDCLIEERHLEVMRLHFPDLEELHLKRVEWSPGLPLPERVIRLELNATEVTPQLAEAIANAKTLEHLTLKNYYDPRLAEEHPSTDDFHKDHSRECLKLDESFFDAISSEIRTALHLHRVNLVSEDWRKLADFKYLSWISMGECYMTQEDIDFLRAHKIGINGAMVFGSDNWAVAP